MADFERLGVCDELVAALDHLGWTLATPVQDEAIPLVLTGSDVCVAAETGSGKTGAFGIPVLQLTVEGIRGIADTPISAFGGPAAPFPGLTPTRTGSCDVRGMEVIGAFQRWVGAVAPCAVASGKYQFEMEVIDGTSRVGWSSPKSEVVGCDAASLGYGLTGKKSFNNTYQDYGPPYTKGDIVGCLLNRDDHCVSFAVNGNALPVAFTIDPALPPLVPAVAGRQFHVKVNLGPELSYPMPGFSPVSECTQTPMSSTPGAPSSDGSCKRSFEAGKGPIALILEPTKDLAQQTYDALISYGAFLGSAMPSVGLFVAGYDENEQKRWLHNGVHIVVGTLSRVHNLVARKQLALSTVRYFVLDEADALLNNDEKKELPSLRKQMPSEVQSLFFSATLHTDKVKAAIARLCRNPTWVDLKGKPNIPSTVHTVCYKVSCADKPPFPTMGSVRPRTDGVHLNDPMCDSQRVKLLKSQVAVAIADKLDMRTCLVFCRTNLDCDNFEQYLIALGGGREFSGRAETGLENKYSCVVLAGMRDPQERRRNLELFKEGQVRFLICTDVAARGIDIQGLPFLIMLTLPDDPDQFFHRAGRVGRAETMGLAIIIVSTVPEKVWYHKCRNRGQGCNNTADVSKGGCCIWYDEPKLLSDIEAKLSAPLRTMDPITFAVPGIIEFHDHAQKGKSTTKTIQIYGKAQLTSPMAMKHVRDLEGAANRCRELDIQVQRNYVEMAARGLRSPRKKL